MKIIKDNPILSVSAITRICDGQRIDLIVHPLHQLIAYKIVAVLLKDFTERNELSKEHEGITYSTEEISALFGANITIIPNLEEREWVLITPDEIYYSKGDNSAEPFSKL